MLLPSSSSTATMGTTIRRPSCTALSSPLRTQRYACARELPMSVAASPTVSVSFLPVDPDIALIAPARFACVAGGIWPPAYCVGIQQGSPLAMASGDRGEVPLRLTACRGSLPCLLTSPDPLP